MPKFVGEYCDLEPMESFKNLLEVVGWIHRSDQFKVILT